MGILTLLTDFGIQDVYVGVMKGAIAQINPTLTVIDLTHAISPQDLFAARFNLMNAVPYFPAETVHVAVVDPGVGGKRDAHNSLHRRIAIQLEVGFLVGPDNGILGGVVEWAMGMSGRVTAIELTNPQYWRTPQPSSTFHGRDIFAPVAAHLASGIPFMELGTEIDLSTLTMLSIPVCETIEEKVHGSIQYIDHFGNLITNIPVTVLDNFLPADEPQRTWRVEIAGKKIPAVPTYSAVPPRALLSLVGSHGYIEIAANGGNAERMLNAQVGTPVSVV